MAARRAGSRDPIGTRGPPFSQIRAEDRKEEERGLLYGTVGVEGDSSIRVRHIKHSCFLIWVTTFSSSVSVSIPFPLHAVCDPIGVCTFLNLRLGGG